MAQTISSEAIEKSTGKTFDYWVEFLDGRSAADLPHKEIARLLHSEGDVSGWWSQMLTVAYEQHIGRRVPGQDCDGEYSVSVSKTLNMPMDDALAWWGKAVDGLDAFADFPITRGPDLSATEKWRYWRAGLSNGSALNVNIYEKAPGKSSLGIQHDKLESAEDAEFWRTFWKQFLKKAVVKLEQPAS